MMVQQGWMLAGLVMTYIPSPEMLELRKKVMIRRRERGKYRPYNNPGQGEMDRAREEFVPRIIKNRRHR